MSYRFVKITSFYRDYLEYYYSRNKNESERSYSDQYRRLMYDSFAWADHFQKNLIKIGVDAYEIIYNAESLQNAWAREHGINLKGKELLLFQLKRIAPDVILFQDSNLFNGEWINYIRSQIPKIKLIIGWCCNPFNSNQMNLSKSFDFMLTCSPLFNMQFIDRGIKSFQLKHAFDQDILKKIKITEIMQTTDFLFTGSFIQSSDFHNERTKIIENLLDYDVNIKVLSKLNIDQPTILILKQTSFILTKFLLYIGFEKLVYSSLLLKKFANLNQMPKNPKFSKQLRTVVQDPVFGLEMFKELASSKITLNIHGGVAGNFAANIRLFEATGVGSCLITDWKTNLNELFEIDYEVVTFKTSEECVEKVKWLINHQAEREKIAIAGQKRVLKDHTFEVRAAQLDEIIRKKLNNY